jgi:hypothetical protein
LNLAYAYATQAFTSDEQYAEFDRITSQPPAVPAAPPVEDRPGRKIVRQLPKPDPSGMREMMRRLEMSGGKLEAKSAR